MSKIISTLFIVCVSATLFSQAPVVIDSMGRIGLGISQPFYPLDIRIHQDDFAGSLIYAEVEGTDPVHDIAIRGLSVPAEGKGIGGLFKGGFQGLKGEAESSIDTQVEGVRGNAFGTGSGIQYGVYGASYGSGLSIGTFGQAATQNPIGFSMGINGHAYGPGTNYAVYGKAENGSTNWAGYFDGDAYVKDHLSIGTNQKDLPLRVVGIQDSFYSSVIRAEVQGNLNANSIAIEGVSTPAAGYGTGGVFRGGQVGVSAEVNAAGTGSFIASKSSVSGGDGSNYGTSSVSSGGLFSHGVAGYSSGGTIYNYGTYGQASGSASCFGSYGTAFGPFDNYGGYGASSGGSLNYGLYGIASGDDGIKYGVYGIAYGTGTKWAGYFDGNTYVDNRLGIGTTDLSDQLHLLESSPGIRIENYSGTYGRFLLNNVNDLNISNSGAYPIRFLSNNLERMRIAGDGKVAINGIAGINNTHLHVTGNENNGASATVRISSGSQYLLMDGNEIDAYGFGMYLNNNSDEDLVLIKGGGRVGINEASPEAMLHIKEYGNNEHAIRIEDDAGISNCSMTMIENELFFYYGGTAKAKIALANGAWTQLSDLRVKKNIDYLREDFLPRVLDLQPAAYHYLDNKESDLKSVGFIAQQAHAVFPEFIDQKEDEMMTLDYDLFSVLAIKSIQELSSLNETLTDRVVVLENKLIDQQILLAQQKMLLERIEKLEAKH